MFQSLNALCDLSAGAAYRCGRQKSPICLRRKENVMDDVSYSAHISNEVCTNERVLGKSTNHRVEFFQTL